MKNPVIELNEKQGKGKIENNTTNYCSPLNTNRTDSNYLYDKLTTEIMSELLTKSANEYKFNK